MKARELDGRVFTIGRIVHFVVSEDEQLPMMITQCRTINGNSFADGVIFGKHHQEPAWFQAGVPYNTSKIDNTWHFPSMRSKKKKGPEPGKPLRNLTASKK